jgi:hypothetical protein
MKSIAATVIAALAVFLLRRRYSSSTDENSAGLWLRFAVLLFGFCLLALVEGILLRPYSFFWLVLIVGITLFVVAKIVPKLLR